MARLKKWILKLTRIKWKDYKCDLKAAYFDVKTSLKELYIVVSKDIIKDQFIYRVDFWKSNEEKIKIFLLFYLIIYIKMTTGMPIYFTTLSFCASWSNTIHDKEDAMKYSSNGHFWLANSKYLINA